MKQSLNNTSSNTAKETAEDLRLKGNDAFSTKDWERALALYQNSAKHHENAKTYANMAATMCKLGQYDQATEAAKRATVIDKTWAKGWWRRGVVAELMKDFASACKYFGIAVKLDPKTSAFQKALKKLDASLGIEKVEGAPTGRVMQVRGAPEGTVIPTKMAYLQVKNEIGGSIYTLCKK